MASSAIPVFPIPKILAALQGMIPYATIGADHLTKPTDQFVQQIYLILLHGAFEINFDEYFERLKVTEVTVDENVQEGLKLVEFYRLIKQLCKVCGILDFSMNDLVEPDPKRTQKVLSAIMNYISFKDHFLDEKLDGIIARWEEEHEAESELESHVAQLAQQVRVREKELDQRKLRIKQVQKEVSTVQTDLDEWKQRADAMRSQESLLQEEKDRRATALNEATAEKEEVKARLERLKSELQLETENKKLNRRKEQLEQEKQAALELQQDVEEWRNKGQRRLENKSNYVAELKSIKELEAKYRRGDAELKATVAEMKDAEAAVQRDRDQLQWTEQKCASIEAKSSKMAERHQKEVAMLQDRLNRGKRESALKDDDMSRFLKLRDKNEDVRNASKEEAMRYDRHMNDLAAMSEIVVAENDKLRAAVDDRKAAFVRSMAEHRDRHEQ